MALTTTLAVAAVGATVAGAQASKSAAKKAGRAFDNVGQGIEKVDAVEASVNQFLGGNMDRTADDNRYKILQDQSYKIVKNQMEGKLSDATQRTLSLRAAETGAGIGANAVGDLNSGYLGIAQEAQVNQGWTNYRQMFGQLAAIGQQQAGMNYQMQANAAGAQAQSILAQGQATAGMWQGIAGIAGGLAGGGGGGGSMMSMFGGGGGGASSNYSGPSQAYYNNMAAAGRNPSPQVNSYTPRGGF